MNLIPQQITNSIAKFVRRAISSLEHPFAAWSILIVSLILTFCAWLIAERNHEHRIQDRFAHRVDRIVETIEERMLEYEQVLRGGIGLYAASDNVSRTEWQCYVTNCELPRFFPGIQGMGVAVSIPETEKQQHEEEIRSQGFPNYQITPSDPRDFYTSIIYLEPFDWRNQRAFGYDMYSNPVRREAMDRAIKTGAPAMSGMVTLVQETDDDVQQGWLYYLPIIKNHKLDKASQRRSGSLKRDDVAGFVYAAFRANDLMAGILDESQNEVKFEIFDSDELTRDRLLFDSDEQCHLESKIESDYSSTVPLSIRGRRWTLHFESLPELLSTSGSSHSSLVACGGLFVDFLLFLVIATIGNQKRQAVKIANEMTKGLRSREKLISGILKNASEAIVTIDENGYVEVANRAAVEMFGFTDSADSPIDFNQYLDCQNWDSLVNKFNQTSDDQYTCTVNAKRGMQTQFRCRLNLGVFTTSKCQYHILVAQDETARIESERKMSEITTELIDASKTAAKVELANGVLHNVGNIVNSISVSTNEVKKQVKRTSAAKLARFCQMIDDHEPGFADFVQHDPRGAKTPLFLEKISNAWTAENNKLERELRDLATNVSHIKAVIATQQSDAKSVSKAQLISPSELISDALVATKAILANHDVEVSYDIDRELSEFESDKHMILQILVNLIKNANDSLVENQSANPKISVRVTGENNLVHFEVADNGVGIAQDKLQKIFQHGYSTKMTGHGFGLHSCDQAAKNLGGQITATSLGVGHGATLRLTIPNTAARSRPNFPPTDLASNLATLSQSTTS